MWMCSLTEPETLDSAEVSTPGTQILAPVLVTFLLLYKTPRAAQLPEEKRFLWLTVPEGEAILVGRHSDKQQA